MNSTASRVKMIEWFRVLLEPGQVVELLAAEVKERWGQKTTHNGYYDTEHLDEFVTDALKLTGRADGVYFTLNPVKPDFLSLRSNREEKCGKDEGAGDGDITHRRWLFIDADPERTPKGISSTDAEKELAREVITEVESYLFDQGWPEPIRADSGNGFHLQYRIDLPAKDGGIVLRCLLALAARFSTPTVKIDDAVFNPVRLCKLYGTVARKGDPTKSRPHRLSAILSIPDRLDIVPIELLERLAAEAPTATTGKSTPAPPRANGHAYQHRDHTYHDSAKIIDRAAKYLAAIPPAVSGQGGHTATLLAAEHMVRGFALEDADAYSLLSDWNQQCQPEWSEAELRHKITSARATGTQVAIGQHLRDTHPPQTGSSSPPRNGSGEPVVGTPPKPRRTPLPAGTLVRCGDRGNIGTVVSDGGDAITVHFVSPSGVEATRDIPASEVTLADGSPVVPSTIEPLWMPTVRELVAENHKLRPPIIHGLLREGETMNIIAATKMGKSWLATLLAIDFVSQRKWLGRFPTSGGDVLLIDNELHRQTSTYRIPAVATANMTHLDEYADHIRVSNLRGKLVSLPELAAKLSLIEPGRFKLIILDAFYRFLPPGTDENDNGAMAHLYNLLDQIADKLHCAIVCIHHSSKGSQAGKSVTDVGSGAGSMSRAADCHVILRPHEKENVVVMEAAARSWPPLKPLCLRWEFPLFSEDTTLDPTLLRPERSREKERSARLAADVERLLDLLREVSEPMTRTDIRDRLALNSQNFNAAFADVLKKNLLEQTTKKSGNGRSYDAYSLHPDSRTSV